MKSLCFIFSVLLLLSCLNETEIKKNVVVVSRTEIHDSNLEIEVIQAVLDRARNTSSKPPSILIREVDELDEDFENRKIKVNEETRLKWENTCFEFIVSDTLTPISTGFPYEFLDDTFVFDSTNVFNRDPQFINLDLIIQNQFKLIEFPHKNSFYRDNLKVIINKEEFHSIFHFSKMLFNKDSSQVIFSYDKVCGSFCGGGQFIKMKKSNGIWELVEVLNIWYA